MTKHMDARGAAALLAVVPALSLGACSGLPTVSEEPEATSVAYPANERECLVRAMYFESNRSSEDGLLAVGTIVMNRVASPSRPKTICGVVGQPGQFAAGVMSKPMHPGEREKVDRVADAILAGKRHPAVAKAMFFHLAGLRFPYPNMHYVLVAGGNAFYEKRQKTEMAASADLPSRKEIANSFVATTSASPALVALESSR